MATSSRLEYRICQQCDSAGHIAKTCPWRYTKYTEPRCIGIRMVVQSELPLSKGKLCLKCQFPTCVGFVWLDDAKNAAKETCELCHSLGHMRTNNIWSNLPCPTEACKGTIPVRVSKTKEHQEYRFSKCNLCHRFDWLVYYMASHEDAMVCDQIMKSSPTSKKMKSDDMNNICNAFTTKVKVKVKNTCYSCNANDQFVNSCPWKGIDCIACCNNIMKLGKSCQPNTMNEAYLHCELYGAFAMFQELQK